MIRRAAPRAGFFLSRHRPQAGGGEPANDGAASIPVVGFVFAPAWKWLKRFLHRRQSTSVP